MAPPPPPPAGSSAIDALQFLSTALSQRGPYALPYAEETKWLIRQHLVSLIEAYPSLHPQTSSFTHNDGRTVNLLQADGTIPIVFGNVFYNIPLSIWLIERYPLSPPSVFLNPTPQMVVKANHPHVDRSGCVHVPYLQNWVYPSSNLVDLVRSLSQIFSNDPPLFSRQNPNSNPPPNPIPSPSPPPNASRFFSSLSPYASRLQGRLTEDANEVFRRNAINKIIEAVHADIAGLHKAREAEIEGLFAIQAELRRREQELACGIREMLEEKEGLEQQLRLVLMNMDLLEGWVRQNEGKWPHEFDVDNVFQPADVLSRQLLECTAADLAVEDTIYSLDKAMQEGSIPSDMYLKNVRALSREQFFHRALETKLRAARVQSQVTSMAARASHYAS
ncbi:protein ELC-like [Dendrobium catenatum]|uniref:Protein ELC n=1 Tax=Dendrobium catenatum TaxID=906689 RepID=A0A2I0WL17_9ASPA|nr:protein ELC-like [Dendrobium catenatum]XP_020705614.1 protein ELC-like [Dendrobium catenatum]XP_020705620.1 protein ELC-like [Dendrobium catenatum]XP_028552053.1 protein ELC-like [Dendrobium catenatum]XP_028552054.1 protein ELC-like [Dendrobium catenatum]PKU76349.1 Protein ELC [Dendrobium catenatum]